VEAVLAFAAALLALRLAGLLLRRYRTERSVELAAWAAALAAYALACAALAWGAAAGWDDRAFRVYYLFGALLTAPLLGIGSLARVGWRPGALVGLVYAGFAAGIAAAMPITTTVAGTSIPAAQDHLAFVPARLVATLGNSIGTIAVVVVALWTIRRRPLGNGLIVAGVACAAAGSAVAGLGVAGTAAFVAAGSLLLYGGFVAPRRLCDLPLFRRPATVRRG
jgi:hypothetical protein